MARRTDDLDGSIFGAGIGGRGGWSISSRSDPRWRAHGSAFVGMYGICDEAKAKIEALKQMYGDMPDDLVYSCMKY